MNISNHFTWKEALYLPQWNREANESDGLDNLIKENLVILFAQMDKLRDFFNKPIKVHVAYRPEAYNIEVKGAVNSAHRKGLACDFHVEGLDCDDARKMIVDAKLLELYTIRMENKPNTDWIHIDCYPIGPSGKRFFIP